MIALLLIASLIAQVPVPARVSPEALGEAYFLFIQGRLLDSKDDIVGAISAYRRALELAPSSSDIHAELAGLYTRQGQVAEARTEAEQALSLAPDNREAHRVLGWIEAALSERAAPGGGGSMLTDAIGHLEKALAGVVNDPSTELTLAELYVRNNQSAKAIPMLQDFLSEHPDYPQALLLLAEAYDGANQPADAARVRAQLGRAQPADSSAAPTAAAEQLEQDGKWDEAASAWGVLARQEPANAAYRLRYATALANSDDTAGALLVLQDFTTRVPQDVAGWYLLAQVQWRVRNGVAAEDAARHIVEIDPQDPRGPLAIAGSRAIRSDYRGVVSVLEPRVAAPSPVDLASGAFAQMATELASALRRLGEPKRAVEMLEAARTRLPDDQDLRFTLGAAYDQDRRYELAERTFRDIIAADPENAEALNYLGYMLADRGKSLEEAVGLINRALAIDADNASFLDSLGWAYYKLSRYAQARPPLEQAAAALPEASVIQIHLGDLYVQLKRYTEATAAFDRALSGDRQDVDVPALTKKRDRARELAAKSAKPAKPAQPTQPTQP